MKGRAALALAVGLAGCVDPDPGRRTVYEEPYTRPTTIVTEVQIVEGAPLTSTPGEGAGVFVEYRGQGDWAITTMCDTKISKLDCTWDLFFEARGSTIDVATPPPGQITAAAITLASGRAELHATNTYGTDAVLLHVGAPTAPLRIEAWIDGKADPRVFFWTGPEVIHEGAPSNPVDFAPVATSNP